MDRNMESLLEMFVGRDLTHPECRRFQQVTGDETGAAVTRRWLAEAEAAGLLAPAGGGRLRLTAAGQAALGEGGPKAAGGPTILKASPRDCPVVKKQRFTRELIISGHNAPGVPLALERVSLRTGEECTPHAHLGTDTVVYTLSGTVRLRFGPKLENVVDVGPEDCVHIPPGVIHYVVNPGEAPMVAVVVRSSAAYRTVEYPHLRALVAGGTTPSKGA